MNSMHAWAHGTAAPQSRDRFYAIFWRKGNRRPDLQSIQQPPAWCPEHGIIRARKAWKNAARAGRYRAQYRFICPETRCKGRPVEPQWLPAASIIDWSDLGTRIGDRARPLAEKTMARIQAGIDRYWTGVDRDPLVVNNVSGSNDSRSSTIRDVAPTMVAGGLHASLLVPVEGRAGKAAAPAALPYRTQTARNETGLLVMGAAGNTYDSADPKHPAHGRPDGYMRVWPGDDPVRTVHTTASKGVAFAPFVTQFRDGAGRRNLDPAREPLNTIVANGAGHGVVALPFIAELRGGGSDARSVEAPLATVTASGNHHALIMRNNEGGAEMSTPASEPVRTVTTAGHQSLITGGTPAIEDCTFRMLTPHEIQQAMAFPADYQLLGTKRDQVRMAGNAVTPPAARDLIAAVAGSLELSA